MGRIKSVSKEALGRAFERLEALPEKEILSVERALGELWPKIRSVLAKGYSPEEILDILKGSGIEIGATTFREWMHRKKSRNGRGTGKSESVRASDDAPSSPPHASPASAAVATDTADSSAEAGASSDTAARNEASAPAGKTADISGAETPGDGATATDGTATTYDGAARTSEPGEKLSDAKRPKSGSGGTDGGRRSEKGDSEGKTGNGKSMGGGNAGRPGHFEIRPDTEEL